MCDMQAGTDALSAAEWLAVLEALTTAVERLRLRGETVPSSTEGSY